MDVINMLRPVQDVSDPASYSRSARSEYRNEDSSFDRTFEEVSRSRDNGRRESEEVSTRDRDVENRRSSESNEVREKEPTQQREKVDDSMKHEKEQPADTSEQQTNTSQEETQQEAPAEPKQEPAAEQNTPAEQSTATDTEAQAVVDPTATQEVTPVNTVSLVEVLADMTQTQGQSTNTNIDPVIKLTLPTMQENVQTNVQTTPLVAEAVNPADLQAASMQDAQQATIAANAQMTAQTVQQVDPTAAAQTQVTQGPSANMPDMSATTATQAQDAHANSQAQAAKPITDANAAKELEALMSQPKATEKIVDQIKQQVPKGEGLAQIRLQPSELGEIQIKRSMENGKPSIQISASESVVQNTLEKNTQLLKSIFNEANVNIVNAQAAKGGNASMSGGDMGNEGFNSLAFQSEANKAGQLSDANRNEAFTARMESALSDRYGIRNLHQHILDQLRIRMDNVKNEARIQLHPPELGEIKIHMAMEERGLTVRMEANEPLTRQLLERDLQQLKDTLAEAGIDVGRFDINSGRDSAQQYRAGSAGGSSSNYEAETSNESDARNGLDTPQGAIRMNPGGSDVDYLVY